MSATSVLAHVEIGNSDDICHHRRANQRQEDAFSDRHPTLGSRQFRWGSGGWCHGNVVLAQAETGRGRLRIAEDVHLIGTGPGRWIQSRLPAQCVCGPVR
jgi:hypothetical protein